MICVKCGNTLLFDNTGSIICVQCDKVNILSKSDALYVAKKQFDWINGGLTQVLNRFDKGRIIAWILGEREKMASLFLTDKPEIPLDDFLSMNALIKRVMQIYEVDGQEEANEKNTPEIIKCFSGFVRIAERHNLIKEGFAYYSKKENLNPDSMSNEILMSNYIFFYNLDWALVMETFKENQILTKEEAENFYKKFEEEYKKNKSATPKPKISTPEEIIEQLHPTFLSFSCALNKNIIYKNTFDFAYLKDKDISPEDILAIVRDFPLKYGTVNGIPPKEFKKYLKQKFKGKDWKNIYNSLVFSHENQEVFPLFVRLDNHILVSICFSKIISLFYYPFYYKNLFVKETEKLSLKFEKYEVPEKFEQSKFKVKTNIKDKKNATLQIDNIAWRDDVLYVVETKVWDIKPLFEHRRTHNNMIRDLKGIIDGKKYTTKDGTTIEKPIPSLVTKLEFVKDNLKDLCPDFANIKKVEGVIVIKSRPLVQRYNGIKIISFNEISKL